MVRFWSVVLLVLLGVSALLAQSGRKVTTIATPSPTPVVDDSTEYSDSKPRSGRTYKPVERFPGIGDGSNVKVDKPAVAVASSENKDDEVLKVETNLITIPVSVFDRNGLYIPGLRRNEFKIYEDGVEQEIAYFGTTDKPFTVVLLIDTSPSTEYKIEEIQRAATAFVDRLEPQDSVIVIEFNDKVRVLSEATMDRNKVYKAIGKTNFGSGTSLYNAVDEALRKQLGKITGRKAVVLFTDGVDTTSRKNTYDSTLNYAEESDTLVFPIYYNTFFQNRQKNGGGGMGGGFPPVFGSPTMAAGTSAEEYALGKKYLEDLAEVTGGRVFRPEATPGGLTAAFEGIAEELRRQYSIGYVPKNEGKPGQRKQIKIRVYRTNVLIRARDSYIVGTSTSTPPADPAKPLN